MLFLSRLQRVRFRAILCKTTTTPVCHRFYAQRFENSCLQSQLVQSQSVIQQKCVEVQTGPAAHHLVSGQCTGVFGGFIYSSREAVYYTTLPETALL